MTQMTIDQEDLWPGRTQTQRVLDALMTCPAGLCGTQLLEMRIPRYAARIQNLRDKGHNIDTVPCPHSWHSHNPRIASYQLRGRHPDSGGEDLGGRTFTDGVGD